jgi:hypothetical protein
MMPHLCTSTLVVYEIGAEDRVYQAVSSSGSSGIRVKQTSGDELALEVREEASWFWSFPPRRSISHDVVGIPELDRGEDGGKASLRTFRHTGAPGDRRWAMTHMDFWS